MKVLITGATYSHNHGHMFFTGSPTVSKHLFDGFMLGGHNPTMAMPNMMIENSEFLKYDLVMFGLTPLVSISARYLYYEMDLRGKCIAAGIPTLWFVDDWQWYQIKSHMKTLIKTYEKRARFGGSRRKGSFEYFMSIEKTVHAILGNFLNGVSSPVVMVFFNPDGSIDANASARMCGNKILMVDPSGVFPKYEVDQIRPEERKREWVLAALGDYTKFLTKLGPLTWPLQALGPTAGRKDHLPEIELVRDIYGKSWGQIVPQYPVKVGRLWRSRYVHSVLAGNIAMTTSNEVKEVLGRPFNAPISVIESTVSPLALERLASAQARAFKKNTWSAEEFADRLNSIVRSTVGIHTYAGG